MNYNINFLSKLLLAVALLVVVQWESVRGSEWGISCREEERSALLQIKVATSFPIQSSSDGMWEGKECCQWDRVTCDPTTGHVTRLDLSVEYDDMCDGSPDCWDISLNASMFLPLHQLTSLSLSGHGIHNCAGMKTWSNLTKLEILDLSENRLNESIIYDLASVSSLRTLILSYNFILISLPINGFESWSNLTKLEVLDLSGNELYTRNISSLAKVSSLRALYLDDNLLDGNVFVKELSALNLEVVSLRGCLLSGSFPYLGYWPSLKALSLTRNGLSSITSEGLCRLKNLEELDLSSNNITGNLPPCMGNLSSLELVDLSYNYDLEIKFPSTIFERLVSLRYLSLSNNKLEGTLSISSFFNHSNFEVLGLSTRSLNFRVEVVNLPFQLQVLELANCILDVEPTFLYTQHKLRVLDLSNTRSKGPLSVLWLLENNTNLIHLDLHKNNFTGSLQLPFLTHAELSILDISDNHVGGELPGDIVIKLPNLMSLSLSKNYFHGPLPLISTSNLDILDLSFNNLIDDIHNSFPRILPSFLDLSNNKFYGSFTNSFNFTQATILLLNDNNISGEIPFSFCNTSLEVMDLSNNELNGVLPDCIGSARPQGLSSVLKLSGNHIEGSLPLEMCVVQGLTFLDLSNNKLSGSIPPCSNQSNLEIVDLSKNNLTGNFPITWLNISNINIIDIGENHLSGELPIWIDKGSNLRMLQARQNLFRGPISEQICQFKYLRILDLSHNNLSGEIPSCIIDMGSTTYYSLPMSVANGNYLGWTELNYSDANFLLHIEYDVHLDGEELTNFGLELMSKGRLDFYWEEILLFQNSQRYRSNEWVDNTEFVEQPFKWRNTEFHVQFAPIRKFGPLSQLFERGNTKRID